MNLPVSSQTFQRDFLGGKGNISVDSELPLNTPLDVLQPIPENVNSLLLVETGGKASAEIGKQGGLQLDISFEAKSRNGIEIIRPEADSDSTDDDEEERLRDVVEGELKANEIGARLFLSAKAAGKIDGNVAAGPVGLKFGIAAGGHVGYDRYLVFHKNAPVDHIVRSLISGIRLPHHTGTPNRIPQPGEVLAFRYGGYLNLNAGIHWGYQINGVEDFDWKGLEGAIEYDVRMKAAVDFSYSLAGEFDIEAHRGSKPGFVRLIVRKSKDRKFGVSAGFHVDAEYKLRDLPGTADEWLTTFFGADAKSVLKTLDKARELTDVDKLEKAVGKLVLPAVERLSEKWLDRALDNSTVTAFVDRLNDVVSAYKQADKLVIGKIIDLYEDQLGTGGLDGLRSALDTIGQLDGRQALKRLLPDSPVWGVVEQLVGGDIHDILGSNKVFAEVREIARRGVQFLDGQWQEGVKDVIDALKAEFNLDALMGRLEKIDSKQELRELEDQLQPLVERILDKTFDAVRDDLGASLKELKKALNKLDSFKDRFESLLSEAYEQSLSLSINAAYSRATSRTGLIDIEFDVTQGRGRQLFADAVKGDFGKVFGKADLDFVIVHEAALSRSVKNSSVMQINVFGWHAKRLVDVVSRTDRSLEAGAGGLIQVFASNASVKRRVKKGGEILESNFLLQLFGANIRENQGETTDSLKQAFLIKTLKKLTIRYDFTQIDNATKPDELTQYLRFGQTLGLIPDAQAESDRLVEEFTHGGAKGLGAVEASYVVKYDPKTMLAVLEVLGGGDNHAKPVDDDHLRQLVSQAFREVVATRFVYLNANAINRPIGFAILDPQIAALYDPGSQKLINSKVVALVPGWSNKDKDRSEELTVAQKRILNSIYNVERTLSRRLVKLDNLIYDAMSEEKDVTDEALEDAARRFVGKGATVDDFGPNNAFFAIVDRLIHAAIGRKGRRDSSLVLKIQPEGAESAVTRYFMRGAPDDPAGQPQPPKSSRRSAKSKAASKGKP